jgi:hyperosmotically inducible periplasmic protein
MKLNNLKQSLALIALSGFVVHANAFDTDKIEKSQSPYHQSFTMFDTNKDGVLNANELSKDSSFTKVRIAQADTDNDGTLDQAEYSEEKAELSKGEAKRVASDSWITTKAKTELLAQEKLKSLKISVETFKGEVMLSGFVKSEDLKVEAEKIVSKIEGVKSVANKIVVKS